MSRMEKIFAHAVMELEKEEKAEWFKALARLISARSL